jgi:hypothetical protein
MKIRYDFFLIFERLRRMHENKTFFLFYNFLQCFDENRVFKYRICKPILSKVDKNNVGNHTF